jgi:flagellin
MITINELKAPQMLVSNKLGETRTNLAKSVNRLTSGLRIHSSIDDPGGMAVSSRLSARVVQSSILQRNLSNMSSFLEVQHAYLMQLSEIYQQRMALDIRRKNPLATSDEIAIYNKQSQMLYERILQIKEAKFDGARLFSTDHNLMTTNVDTSLINGAAETISQFNLFTQNDPKPVEMIFLMDYSGSMQTTIDNVRNNVASFVSAIQTRLNASTWQAKAVAYRGLSGPNRHDFFAPNGGNFVTSTGALQSQLGQITASGGGTPGETLIDGINDALNIGGGWQYSNSKKVLMAFTDEPSDPIRTPGLTLTDVTNRLNQDDVNFWLFSDYPNGQAGYDSLTPQLISQSGANTNTLANAN